MTVGDDVPRDGCAASLHCGSQVRRTGGSSGTRRFLPDCESRERAVVGEDAAERRLQVEGRVPIR